MNDNIKKLANEWDRAFVTMLKEEEYSFRQVERLLNETYRVCTEYCDKDMVPKELCKVFSNIDFFLNAMLDIYHIDGSTASSASADYDAVEYIVDVIEEGFYTGRYKSAYPLLSVNDNKQIEHVYDTNKYFLEDFIDALR